MLTRVRRYLPRAADVAAAAAVLGMLALLILWLRSPRLGGDERVLDARGGRLHFVSRDGRVALGVFWPERGWRARWQPAMGDLISDKRWGFISIRGWGVAAPHGVFIAMLAIVPAWWWFVHRDRLEEQRRRFSGMCRKCGYDLRVTTTRCPECGTDIGVAGLGRLVRPIEGLTADRFEPPPPRGDVGTANPSTAA